MVAAGDRSRGARSALLTAARAPVDDLVGASLEEAREAVVVAVRADEADLGLERLRVDQVFERHVREIELADDADEVAVVVFLDERAVRADAELAAEHD